MRVAQWVRAARQAKGLSFSLYSLGAIKKDGTRADLKKKKSAWQEPGAWAGGTEMSTDLGDTLPGLKSQPSYRVRRLGQAPGSFNASVFSSVKWACYDQYPPCKVVLRIK